MGVVVADAGPLHYLVLIDAVDLLPSLFGNVLIPEIVRTELSHVRAPAPVRSWLATGPAWLEARPTPAAATLPYPRLGLGEHAAIALAQAVAATLVLMDDRAGVACARAEGLEATGTLGVLARGAARGLVELKPALTRLRGNEFPLPAGVAGRDADARRAGNAMNQLPAPVVPTAIVVPGATAVRGCPARRPANGERLVAVGTPPPVKAGRPRLPF